MSTDKFEGFVQVGHVDVDSGSIWIGDPCYVIKDHDQPRPKDLGNRWSDVCARFFERSGYEAVKEARHVHQRKFYDEFNAKLMKAIELAKQQGDKFNVHDLPNVVEAEVEWNKKNPFIQPEGLDKGVANFTHDLGHGGMGLMLNTNWGDGTYPVYIKYGANGRPALVLIDFYAEDVEGPHSDEEQD